MSTQIALDYKQVLFCVPFLITGTYSAFHIFTALMFKKEFIYANNSR